jgi:RloB-like protein
LPRKLRDLKRRRPYIAERRRFILISEGKNTERAYFKALESKYHRSNITVDFVGPAGVPITIRDKVQTHIAELREKQKHDPSAVDDTVWAVFDCDIHDNVPEAIAGCERAGAGVAYSNPCFEVWLILHHNDYHAADDRHQVQKRYQTLDAKYDANGSKIPDCAFLMEEGVVEKAEKLAEIQCKRREEEGAVLGRPSTTVHLLTRAIRSAAEAARPRRI